MSIIQMVIGLGILNVWLLRRDKTTAWRGQQARNLKEEFGVYGLPPWFMGVIGFFKILFAALLILGVWLPSLTRPAAMGMAVLMLGAVSMHLKVKDPLKKSLPAFTLLVLCIVVALTAA
ncbi:MAG: DoxX family protein [Vicinamibacteria bacterium]